MLEITESNGIPNTASATRILTRLRICGVNLSIDDFGTGHSSMPPLLRMPFNEMKIDQAFLREAVVSRDARKVVRASATLGRELGLKVVAEGVETEAMALLAGDAGCHVGRGWLYGHAVPPEVFEAELADSIEASDGVRVNRLAPTCIRDDGEIVSPLLASPRTASGPLARWQTFPTGGQADRT